MCIDIIRYYWCGENLNIIQISNDLNHFLANFKIFNILQDFSILHVRLKTLTEASQYIFQCGIKTFLIII